MDIRVVTALVIAYKALPENSPVRLKMLRLVPGLDEHVRETAEVIPFPRHHRKDIEQPKDNTPRHYVVELFCTGANATIQCLHAVDVIVPPDGIEDAKVYELHRYRQTHDHGTLRIWAEAKLIDEATRNG